jgi:hypothetical protein
MIPKMPETSMLLKRRRAVRRRHKSRFFSERRFIAAIFLSARVAAAMISVYLHRVLFDRAQTKKRPNAN